MLVSNTDKGTEIEKFFWTKVHKLAFSCLYYLNDKNQRFPLYVSIVYVCFHCICAPKKQKSTTTVYSNK